MAQQLAGTSACDRWFVTDWPNVVSAGAEAGTFGVAVVAAGFGYRQVREARRLREEHAQPYVFVDLQSTIGSASHIDFLIKNVGTTAAFKIRPAFDPLPKSTLYPTQ